MCLFESHDCGKFCPSCGISPQVTCGRDFSPNDACVGDGMVVPDFFSSFALIPIIELMYQEYPPHPVLSPYIDKYWEVKGSPEMGEKMKFCLMVVPISFLTWMMHVTWRIKIGLVLILYTVISWER